ncbi:MAG: RNA polymerase sigma factor [Candidatus Omnitrophica bacterium]|nr:RNA polymerase sigma factor [Candidatus Omnitrophota bacterium]MBU4478041.1 RNA polymerase sigma factor [Candidatus Omnitrophota bacterium]MCG2704324.1 RNA polymerase sigma factor [Candidatus Omnitrophota bacterium]
MNNYDIKNSVHSQIDEELVTKAQDGDADAFRCLVERHKERAVRLCFSVVGNLNDAQDISQEAFIRVYRNIGAFKLKARFSTWFYRILINLCRDWLKSRKRSRLVLDRHDAEDKNSVNEMPDNTSPDAARTLLNKELSKKINEAIIQLSPKQQLVFKLKHKQGVKVEEIALMLDMNSSTVKVHLFRAMQTLQKKLCGYLRSSG